MFRSSSKISILILWVLCVGTVSGIKYDTGGGVVQGKLNVHLVPHSHDDVGWLKTVDQYYIGSNTSNQAACVENTLDSVFEALVRDPNRKFSFAEMAFFQRWWVTQSSEIQEQVKKLVDIGSLEFVNGGWCMHDEAAAHYIDMIDQTTLGHRLIKDNFNKTPRAGWQIDPFGHSAVQAYMLGAELGFDSLHFGRIDYQDREKRKGDKSLEVIWRASTTFGSTSQIFANAFPIDYYAPKGFYFEVNDEECTLFQDNPILFDYNVQQRVNNFIAAALTQANVTRTNHIMWTMGGDFAYQYAETWFKQMDKFIHYLKKDGRVNALYSTPSLYVDAKNAENQTWPLKTHDYFPYADDAHAYWTGFFTSRPGLKRYVRALSGYYMAARQLEFFDGRRSKTGPTTYELGDALGIAQHHDSITGTAQQHVTNDYMKRLAIGAATAEAVVNNALACLVSKGSGGDGCQAPTSTFSQCPLLNISFCPSTEANIAEDQNLVIVAYNPVGWSRVEFIRVPVEDSNLVVQDSSGKTIEAQFVEIDKVTLNLRNKYTQAYGVTLPAKVPKYWLVFQVTVPPLGWNTYFISKHSSKGSSIEHSLNSKKEIHHHDDHHHHHHHHDHDHHHHHHHHDHHHEGAGKSSNSAQRNDDPIEIGPGNVKMVFSSSSGRLVRMYNKGTGVDLSIDQSILYYNSSTGGSESYQASGAYIFRPEEDTPNAVSKSVPKLKVVRGSLVDEVHQQFSSWVYQVTRLYKDKEYAEVEYTIGPIPAEDNVGKEVVTRLTTNMATNKTFYTDSNGRDFLKRIRDYREDWPLVVNERVAGNYYPINLGIFAVDDKFELSVLVDRAVGGGSIRDGELELMFHRRLFEDDNKGVTESLSETICYGINSTCEGLTVRGNYYVSVDQIGKGAQWRRQTGQEVYSPIVLAFSHEKLENWTASHITESSLIDPSYSLPPNAALITLEELNDGTVLLRLAHLFEVGEDPNLSKLTKVELKKMFVRKMIKEVKEMSLSANQLKSEMKRMSWKVEEDRNTESTAPIRGGPIDSSTLIVELGPMEIRTFLLKF